VPEVDHFSLNLSENANRRTLYREGRDMRTLADSWVRALWSVAYYRLSALLEAEVGRVSKNGVFPKSREVFMHVCGMNAEFPRSELTGRTMPGQP
jgi:hypothetical protein